MPRRLVLHQHWPEGWYPMRHDVGPPPPFGETDEPYPFLTVAGTGVYEIPVGPIHAGLIEPGHFRFSVVGETILKLKARLWFVHKGIEKLAEGKLIADALPLAARVSGDTTVGHTTWLAAGRTSGVGLVEGWRGTIAHRVESAPDGAVARLKIVDPSFFNWPALPVALADTIVPDFSPDQQELQPLLRRERPMSARRHMKIETVQRWVASVILIHAGTVPAVTLASAQRAPTVSRSMAHASELAPSPARLTL
jgi:hypothetical protein